LPGVREAEQGPGNSPDNDHRQSEDERH
jgi:hypothetical protein